MARFVGQKDVNQQKLLLISVLVLHLNKPNLKAVHLGDLQHQRLHQLNPKITGEHRHAQVTMHPEKSHR
jgi:hypothetical protein